MVFVFSSALQIFTKCISVSLHEGLLTFFHLHFLNYFRTINENLLGIHFCTLIVFFLVSLEVKHKLVTPETKATNTESSTGVLITPTLPPVTKVINSILTTQKQSTNGLSTTVDYSRGKPIYIAIQRRRVTALLQSLFSTLASY